MIKIYGKPNCKNCDIVKNKFIDVSIPHEYICNEEIAITEAKLLRSRGGLLEMNMPIVIDANGEQVVHEKISSFIGGMI